jgi:hypothetical protein
METDMPRLSEIYGGNYLKAEDLGSLSPVVIIEEVSVMSADDGKKKLVLHFHGKDKTLVLNVTNANMVQELLGSDDTDDWLGKRIRLYTTKVDFQGKRVSAIRIKAASKAAPPPEPDDDIEDDSEPVPF